MLHSSSTQLIVLNYLNNKKIALHTLESLPKILHRVSILNNTVLFFTDASKMPFFAFFIRNASFFQGMTLVDIVCSDKPNYLGRFSLKYIFFSICYNSRVQLNTFTTSLLQVPSISSTFLKYYFLFPAAGWLEREVWDLFGVYFYNHLDLRRILTDYGFSGHPLRKDFPLTGFLEIAYSDIDGRIVSSPVELTQEFRVFHF